MNPRLFCLPALILALPTASFAADPAPPPVEQANDKKDGAPSATPPPKAAEIAGVGAVMIFDDVAFHVADLLPDSAAAASGLIHKGDRILAVGEGEQPSQAVAGHTLKEVVTMMRGREGSRVRITIVPAGGEGGAAQEVLLTRRKLEVTAGLDFEGRFFKPGDKAPELRYLRLADGQRASLGSEHPGKIVVLEFWATWCSPCQRAMEDLQKTAASFADRKDKIDFLTISIDGAENASDAPDAISKVVARVKQKGWTRTINGWSTFEELKAWGVAHVPTTYIIGTDGKIIIGDPTERLEDVIAPILKP